ncbi:hypothetical protein I8752_29530 [Nostocaceae cyanobacterium CENA369]|uniref:Uncharacterized protein n=1 Tax=Dendronalium phyllosphericum CENA369 TaxID=1725256 RepID=A0A8J7IP86_9NOST|nr:hypothetical protein [Dendronalium phyllosphericum]MBH8577052.1 hypothetical protein [Dendronalium phyllosphericum CENA369]
MSAVRSRCVWGGLYQFASRKSQVIVLGLAVNGTSTSGVAVSLWFQHLRSLPSITELKV